MYTVRHRNKTRQAQSAYCKTKRQPVGKLLLTESGVASPRVLCRWRCVRRRPMAPALLLLELPAAFPQQSSAHTKPRLQLSHHSNGKGARGRPDTRVTFSLPTVQQSHRRHVSFKLAQRRARLSPAAFPRCLMRVLHVVLRAIVRAQLVATEDVCEWVRTCTTQQTSTNQQYALCYRRPQCMPSNPYRQQVIDTDLNCQHFHAHRLPCSQ